MMLFFLLSLATFALAAPSPALVRRASPSVSFSYATVVGTSSGGVDSFKGIPFAQPPTGSLRLKPPQPIASNLGTIESQSNPTSCPQFLTPSDQIPQDIIGYLLNTAIFQAATGAGEDCLTLNVQRPSTANSTTKLPVLFWIYGGGFELGSDGMYDGTDLVTKSITDGDPILFVEVNYRVGGFGFMPGKELQDEGSSNLGLLDQRLGLQWVADNIEAFGGDPDKVTIWGESAGSISVLDQMILYNGDNTYNGKSLFRGAIMNSGSVVPANPVDTPKAQAVYDQVVQMSGCSNSTDTLACLRALPYEQFLDAANSVPGILDYQSLMLSYVPRPDGTVLTDSPDALVLGGQYAKVPFIIGDQNDEGTLFALVQNNLTTTQDVVDYFKSLYFLDATEEQVEQLVATYPDDPTQGSPFGTGDLYSIYPQYKRLAAILGDLVFTLARRAVLASVGSTVPTWSYLATYGSGTPLLGTNHGSDILYDFGTESGFEATSINTYYINFVNNLDPNQGINATGLINWPNWNDGNQLLDFGSTNNTLTPDDFREDSYNFLVANLNSLRV